MSYRHPWVFIPISSSLHRVPQKLYIVYGGESPRSINCVKDASRRLNQGGRLGPPQVVQASEHSSCLKLIGGIGLDQSHLPLARQLWTKRHCKC